MRMQDIGALIYCYLAQSPLQTVSYCNLFQQWQPMESPGRAGGAVEIESIDLLFEAAVTGMLGTRNLAGSPTQRPLMLQNGQSTKCIPAVQWYGVIQDVENFQLGQEAQLTLRWLSTRLP